MSAPYCQKCQRTYSETVHVCKPAGVREWWIGHTEDDDIVLPSREAAHKWYEDLYHECSIHHVIEKSVLDEALNAHAKLAGECAVAEHELKKALAERDGDFEKAYAVVAKRENRITKERDELRAEVDRTQKAYDRMVKEYDDYINGRPGSWYIVELKKERDRLREALQWISENSGHKELCEGVALNFCDVGCDVAKKAREALGQ